MYQGTCMLRYILYLYWNHDENLNHSWIKMAEKIMMWEKNGTLRPHTFVNPLNPIVHFWLHHTAHYAENSQCGHPLCRTCQHIQTRILSWALPLATPTMYEQQQPARRGTPSTSSNAGNANCSTWRRHKTLSILAFYPGCSLKKLPIGTSSLHTPLLHTLQTSSRWTVNNYFCLLDMWHSV